MRRLLVLVLLAWAAVAQQVRPADLQSPDWRARNRAARTLAVAATTDIGGLIAVLRESWDGTVPSMGRFGGRGRGRPSEPRERVRYVARQELALRRSWGVSSSERDLREARDLVVPWHPHDLARWVLQARTGERQAVAAAVAVLPRASVEVARVWLRCAAPSAEQVAAAMQAGESGRALAQALWLEGDGGRARLRAVLESGPRAARDCVLQLLDDELLGSEAAIDGVIDYWLAADSPVGRGDAGSLLVAAGARAVPGLMRRLRAAGVSLADCRAILGLLTLLGHRVDGVAAAVAPYVDHEDIVTRHRAIVALAACEVPRHLQSGLAERLFVEFRSRRDLASRVLALDALGRLPAGVPREMRKALQNSLGLRHLTIRGRVLACLGALGAVDEIPIDRRAYLADAGCATTESWFAVVDAGAAAGPVMLANTERWVEHHGRACGERLALRAPAVLRAWLDHEDSRIRRVAIEGLHSLGAVSEVPTARIAALLATASGREVYRAMDWLASRPDAAAYADAAIAATLRESADGTFSPGIEFLAGLDWSAAKKIAALTPMLRRGVGLAAVRDGDSSQFATAIEAWIEAAQSPEARVALLGELARIGAWTAGRVGRLRAALRDSDVRHYPILRGLRQAPSLPDALRSEVESLIDRYLEDAEDPLRSIHAWDAAAVLWQHRG